MAKSKKLTALILAFSIILSSIINASAVSFKDTGGHWAENVIEKWYSEGVIGGYNGCFYPNNCITRGDVAVILCRYKKYETMALNNFNDLSFSEYYADEILKLAYEKIIFGDENGNIRPKDYITREEAFVMINRICKYTAKGAPFFEDNDKISSWAKSDVFALCEKNIVKGSNGYINPKNNITRAEFVQLINNMNVADSIVDFETVIGADDIWSGELK